MTNLSPIDINPWPGFEQRILAGSAGPLSIRVNERGTAGAVLFNHSILTGSATWRRQADRLANNGWFVICLDTRGHGQSPATPPPYTMNDLVLDNIAVLDALEIVRVHFVGVSLGGMTGLGLGIDHGDRLASLCICAARADAPPPVAAVWDPRIALARKDGAGALAQSSAERWFGADFLRREPEIAGRLTECIRQTSTDGFVGCAQALQGLDYLDRVSRISVQTSLIIGSRDESLLQPMRDLARLVERSHLIEIDGAGHLPQIDQPDAFDAALDSHLARSRRTG